MACECDPRLATAPATFTLAGDVVKLGHRPGSLLPAATVIGLLLHHRGGQPLVDLETCRLFIDKLAITFDTAYARKLLTIVANHGRTSTTKRPIYAHESRCGDVFVQHRPLPGSFASRTSRLEFNPATASPSDTKLVKRLVAIAKNIRISRVDVAIDVPVSIRRFQVLSSTRQKVVTYSGPAGIETLYLGKRGADRQIRLYDRQKRLHERGHLPPCDGPLTRIEAELHHVRVSLSELASLKDPFSHLQLFDLSSGDLPLPQALLLNYARVFGLATLRDHLERNEFVALVNARPRSSLLPHPSAVFDQQWSGAVATLLRELNVP